MKLMLLVFLMAIGFKSKAQIQTFNVPVVSTNVNYDSNEEDHTILINTNFRNNKLFLYFGGTDASTSSYVALMNRAAEIGYDVINLSYFNDVAAASLAGNSDSLIFNQFRQEICFGTPVCDAVNIDTLNSIHQRTLYLIQYLAQTYPAHNWSQYFISSENLNWSQIAVGGHSQGSGHAAYLAKFFDVDRVLMFSGPNDYHNTYSRSANWLRTPGITGISKHFSYLSLNDEIVDYAKQYANIEGLGLLVSDDSTHIDNINSPYGNSRCLYTTQPPGFVLINHNVPIKNTPVNLNVWTYMLTDISSLAASNNPPNTIQLYPNPAQTHFTLRSSENYINQEYQITSISGDVLMHNKIEQIHEVIDVESLPSGSYFLTINSVAYPFFVE